MVFNRPSQSRKPFHLDKTLIVLLVLMAILSLIAIYGAIPITPSWINGMRFFTNQIVWYILGFAFLIGLLFFGIDRLFTGITVFYWILIFALFLLYLDKFINIPFVQPINGARAWFIFPGFGNFQPSEFMKIVLIILTANIVDAHNRSIRTITYWTDLSLFYKIARVVVLPLILIVTQPDTGIPIIIVFSILAIIFVSGIKYFWVFLGLTAAVLIFGGAIYLFETNPQVLADILGASYKLNRFYGWLETEKYFQTWGHQLYTALLAVGSAGWTGHGTQSVLISFAEPQNDFIFAVIGKNYGFMGTSIVLITSLVFNIKLLIIALKYENSRERYMVAGLLGMLFYQQFQNMGMIVGILPITGITMPLISYGGSSLLSYMIPLAIIFHMSSENYNRTLH